MNVAIVGSGIIGVASAWWLKQAGHVVVVVDRCSGPARETSLANGAQISVSYAEPWANPQAPLKLLVLVPRIDVHELSAGGVTQKVPDLTRQANQHFEAALSPAAALLTSASR